MPIYPFPVNYSERRASTAFTRAARAAGTADAITAAAGMAKRTVYARYGDKETLFKAALARAIEDWMVPVERLLSGRDRSVPSHFRTPCRMARYSNLMTGKRRRMAGEVPCRA